MVDKTKPAASRTQQREATKQEVLPPGPMPKKGGEVAVTTMSSVPDFMKADAGMGAENMTREMMDIPRLKLLQATSEEVENNDELRAGYFYHTTAEESLGRSFVGVVVYFEEQFILWNPLEAGGGILARTNDGEHWSPPNVSFTVRLDKQDGGHEVTWVTKDTVRQSGLEQFGTFNPNDPKSPPAATRMFNFLIAFPERPDLMPAVLSFQRSSMKYGRQLVTKVRSFTARGPMFGAKFRFSSESATSAGGKPYQTMKAAAVGVVTDAAQYEEYKNWHLAVKGRGLDIKDVTELQTEGAADADHDGNDVGTAPGERQGY